jgi:hypothetical protein
MILEKKYLWISKNILNIIIISRMIKQCPSYSDSLYVAYYHIPSNDLKHHNYLKN